MNDRLYTQGLVKTVVGDGVGCIRPIVFNFPHNLGISLMNPSIINLDGRLIANIRCVNYMMHHSQNNEYPHWGGPLQYIHPENDVRLATENFVVEFDEDLLPKSAKYLTMMELHTPIWEFHGLEDIRLTYWDNKLYACGVRRDTTPNGEGRIELCELEETEHNFIERTRDRMPSPEEGAYCEKNWMPILDRPFEFVRWANPTEIVKYDLESKTITSNKRDLVNQLSVRGGSQVIKLKNYYIALGHSVQIWKPLSGEKDAAYYHEFMLWDNDFNLIKVTNPFKFTNFRIEFSCGMCSYGDDVIISYSEMDNEAYLLKVNADWLIDQIINS